MKQKEKLSEAALRGLVVKACHALACKNLVAATDGNVSARLNEGSILVTPSGCNKGEVEAKDLLICDLEGRKIKGATAPSIEVQVHLAAYRARPHVGGVVHAHPPVATAFTFAGMEHLLQEPLVPEVVAIFGTIPTAPYFTPGTPELAEAFEALVLDHDAVMLARHGAVTVAEDPWKAYLKLEKLEHFALMLKFAREIAGTKPLKYLSQGEVAALRKEKAASAYAAVPACKCKRKCQ